MSEKERIFVIGPVRKAGVETLSRMGKHVAMREAQGYKVHWPFRDTPQDDPVGLRICSVNRGAIYDSDKVECYVDETSEASKFDLGMFYYFLRGTHKGFEVINEEELGWNGPARMTLEDVLLELGVTGVSPSEAGREAMHRSSEILVLVDRTNPTALFRMGMAFASLLDQPKKSIRIANRHQISRTPHKSFENVFLELAEAV